MRYKITLTKTANGLQEYMQVISEDSFSVNVVLIGEFELLDGRKPEIPARKPNAKGTKGDTT